ncbi:MAG TPA: metal-dependent hydrolase [Polyangiaceae bacterium]|nr:metal-dependent hydrolase [Polyangiaceae bacterium]
MQLERVPRVRSPNVGLGGIPRHWFGGNVVATHVANGVNLLFPAGERFFIRSVRHYLDRIEDPELRARIKGFFGQEGRHSKEHDDFNEILEGQGYEVQRFLALYERIAYGFIERVAPPRLRLSTTAACEHFTAILAENALRMRFLDIADPAMRSLLLWHAAEEIEHRSVAYDVLQLVDPSYAMRVAGLAMAAACLGGFWAAGTLHLLAQERKLGSKASLHADWKSMREYRSSLGERRFVFLEGIKQYLQPGFHPSQNDVDRLASEYLTSVGLA